VSRSHILRTFVRSDSIPTNIATDRDDYEDARNRVTLRLIRGCYFAVTEKVLITYTTVSLVMFVTHVDRFKFVGRSFLERDLQS